MKINCRKSIKEFVCDSSSSNSSNSSRRSQGRGRREREREREEQHMQWLYARDWNTCNKLIEKHKDYYMCKEYLTDYKNRICTLSMYEKGWQS